MAECFFCPSKKCFTRIVQMIAFLSLLIVFIAVDCSAKIYEPYTCETTPTEPQGPFVQSTTRNNITLRARYALPALMSLDARRHLEETRHQVDTDPSTPNASSAPTSKSSTNRSSANDSYKTAAAESPEGAGDPAARRRLEEAWARYQEANAARLRSPVRRGACTFSCTMSRSRAIWSTSASRIAGTADTRSGCRS